MSDSIKVRGIPAVLTRGRSAGIRAFRISHVWLGWCWPLLPFPRVCAGSQLAEGPAVSELLTALDFLKIRLTLAFELGCGERTVQYSIGNHINIKTQ